MQILAVENLVKKFGELTAVDDLSFAVDEGEFFAFLGQNGAGKSTTINVLLGLLKEDGGTVRYGGENYASFKNSIGVVFQNNIFDDLLSVEENLLLYGRLYLGDGAKVKIRYREISELLGLHAYAKQRFKTLSGGQKRKAEIARALFNNPKLLFLDEPTTGLDPKTRAEVWAVLHDLRKKTGMTVFLTTHYMEETASADHVVIIHGGKKICEGSPAELKAKYSFDRLLITPKSGGEMQTVKVSSATEAIEYLHSHKDDIRFFEAVKGSMDDVFLNVVGEKIGGDE